MKMKSKGLGGSFPRTLSLLPQEGSKPGEERLWDMGLLNFPDSGVAPRWQGCERQSRLPAAGYKWALGAERRQRCTCVHRQTSWHWRRLDWCFLKELTWGTSGSPNTLVLTPARMLCTTPNLDRASKVEKYQGDGSHCWYFQHRAGA